MNLVPPLVKQTNTSWASRRNSLSSVFQVNIYCYHHHHQEHNHHCQCHPACYFHISSECLPACGRLHFIVIYLHHHHACLGGCRKKVLSCHITAQGSWARGCPDLHHQQHDSCPIIIIIKKRTITYHQQQDSYPTFTLSSSTTGQLPYIHLIIIDNRTVTLHLPYHHRQQDSYPSIIINNWTVIINNSRTFTLSAAAAASTTSQNLPCHIPVPGPPIGGCSQTVPGPSPPLPASCCVWHSMPEWSRCAACHPQRTCCAPETATSAITHSTKTLQKTDHRVHLCPENLNTILSKDSRLCLLH